MRHYPSCIAALWLSLIRNPAWTSGLSLTGKRVLVTGSSGGIGRGLAIKLAEEGAEVFVHYNEREEGARETRRLIEAQGGRCAGISQCDFSHPANIHALFQQINGVWREGMDILVNNAGIITKLACEDDDDYVTQWRDTMNINLNAPRLLSQLALKGMKRRGGGVIINVSSIHGDRSCEYMSAYAVSKAGLDALTRCMAIEFAEYKVRVNGIAPGVVKVERTEQHFRDPANVTPWTDRLLINEIGAVKNIADAALPLITNDWITGTIWQIDGGMSARSNMPLRTRPQGYTPRKLPELAERNTVSEQKPVIPAPYGGERLGERPMPGQVAPPTPRQQGYNAGRLADQPMPGQPGFGEQPRGNPARQGEGAYAGQPPGRPILPDYGGQQGPRMPPNDRRDPGFGPQGGVPPPRSSGQPNIPGPNYGRPPPDTRREDPRRGPMPPYMPDNMQDLGDVPGGRSMNMPGQNDAFGSGMPGQGYIPRGGGQPGSPPDTYGRRDEYPPRGGGDYRPMGDPNDERPPGSSYREPRTQL